MHMPGEFYEFYEFWIFTASRFVTLATFLNTLSVM